MTYTLIDSTVLGSAASSVTFSGISATGKGDLVLVTNIQPPASSVTQAYLRFNSDTGSNYSLVGMYGNGSSAGSYTATATSLSLSYYGSVGSGGSFLGITHIMDFAESKHKTVLSRIGSSPVAAEAGRWANTAAITSLEIFKSGQDFAAGSSFYLYQIVSE